MGVWGRVKGDAMSPAARRVRDTFVAAVQLPPDRWDAFLEEACAGEEGLRREVRDLLREHQRAGGAGRRLA